MNGRIIANVDFQKLKACECKITLQTRQEAIKKARKINNGKKMRVYKCRYCKKYHLTSAAKHGR